MTKSKTNHLLRRKNEMNYDFYQKMSKNQYAEKFENYMNISNEIELNDIQNYELEI